MEDISRLQQAQLDGLRSEPHETMRHLERELAAAANVEDFAYEPRRARRVPISELRGKTNPLPNATPDQAVDLGHPNAYPFMEWAATKMEERAEREREPKSGPYPHFVSPEEKKDPQDTGFVIWPGKKTGYYGDWDRSQMFRKAKHKRRAASRNARSARRRARR